MIYWLWTDTYIITNVSLFVFLPLAYFYNETEDFEMRNKTYFAKLRYVFYNWSLLNVMLGGIVWVIHQLISSVFNATPDYLPFSYALIGLGGSVGGMCMYLGSILLIH